MLHVKLKLLLLEVKLMRKAAKILVTSAAPEVVVRWDIGWDLKFTRKRVDRLPER